MRPQSDWSCWPIIGAFCLLAAAASCDGYLHIEHGSTSGDDSSTQSPHGHRGTSPSSSVSEPDREGSGEDGTESSEGRTPDPDESKSCQKAVADVPPRMLTSAEINHALQQLFPELDLEPVEMVNDSRVGPFVLNAREKVSKSHVGDFRRMAESVADRAVENLDQILDCSSATGNQTECAHTFVEEFATRAFRRPLSETEREQILGLYDAGRASNGHAQGMRWVFEALLQAPSFIYVHEEATDSGDPTPLSGYEIAQRMAALTWRSLPDPTLLEAAEDGSLTGAAEREEQVRRMLAAPRGREALVSLVMQWSGVDQLAATDVADLEKPEELVASMRRETRRMIRHVLEERNGDWRELLTARYTFVDERLASHYDLDLSEATNVDDGVWRVEMPHRAGILTHAAFLSQVHGPIHRGLAIRTGLLCGSVPGPMGVDTEAIETEPGESERSKSEKRLAKAGCAGCHRQMDPLGLPFEAFGPSGRYRVEDQHGNAIETTGEISGTSNSDGEVADVRGLVDRLAASDQVQRCLARNMFVWAYGREPTGEDRCAVDRISTALNESGGDLREALVAVVTQEAFTQQVRERTGEAQ